uniref:Autophagy-related protein n=1 Tax=Haemonchus placei TaxID=6290 RepID=A0A0N4W879_HAEPC
LWRHTAGKQHFWTTFQYFCIFFPGQATLISDMTCLFGEPFVKSVNGTKPVEDVPPTGIVRHKQGDPFYVNWLATTISEWVLALLIEFYVLTYAYDLSRNFMSSTKGSHCSSVIDGHLKRMSYEPPVDHGYPEQFSSAGAYFGTPSRRRLYRVDQVYASSGYNPPRALPRTMIAPTSNGDRYQYF